MVVVGVNFDFGHSITYRVPFGQFGRIGFAVGQNDGTYTN